MVFTERETLGVVTYSKGEWSSKPVVEPPFLVRHSGLPSCFDLWLVFLPPSISLRFNAGRETHLHGDRSAQTSIASARRWC